MLKCLIVRLLLSIIDENLAAYDKRYTKIYKCYNLGYITIN